MRQWVLAAFLLAACQQQPKPAQRVLAFDGAEAKSSAAILAHGKRLTYVLGCRGCHGKDLKGTFFTQDEPQYGPLYASNLTIEVPKYSDAQLDGIIRHGVHPERETVWGMPSEIFQHLSEPDFKAVVAYLRTLKPAGKRLPDPQFSVQDRKDIASGDYKPAVQLVRERARLVPVDLGPEHALGRYITEVTCAECHGPGLEGNPKDPAGKTPNLVVAGAYTRGEFEQLITNGVPTGGRKLNPMMSIVAKRRFSNLTAHERDALYDYLKARAEQPQ
jgi:mono/diheme cytochrome c family protein